MIVWLILVVFTAAINLFVFIAVRGRWGRLVYVLFVASLIGSAIGNIAGERLGVELLRIGSFNVLPASVAAQLAMVATALLAAMAPPSAPHGNGPDA
jgi:uncharacterized membrane protein